MPTRKRTPKRTSTINRKTNETEIELTVSLDGTGSTRVDTGIGFLDHLFSSLGKHSRLDLIITCKGDLEVDDHHTAEDCALTLGTAIDESLGDRKGIARFGWAYAPLDEALARAVVDLSGRPWTDVNLGLGLDKLGELNAENVPHVIQSLGIAMKAAVHVEVLKGANDHHRAEAAFKALALAVRQAVARDSNNDEVPSTKGVLK